MVAKGRVPSLSPRNRISGRARAPRGGSGPTGARPAAPSVRPGRAAGPRGAAHVPALVPPPPKREGLDP